MKQKGKRFFVEEKSNKTKNTSKEQETFDVKDVKELNNPSDIFESEIDAKADDFKPEPAFVNRKTDKSEKIRAMQKEKISKKLEKNRAKALKKSGKSTNKEDIVNSSDSTNSHKKVLKFEKKVNTTRFERFAKSLRLHKKNIVLSAVIILVLLLSVVVFSNRDRLSFSSIKNWVEYGIFNTDSEEHFPLTTDGGVISIGNFNRIGRNLVYSSDIKFSTVNNYGRVIFENAQSFTNPVLSQATDSDLTLVYNLGGKGFSVYTLDSLVYTGEAQDNIVVADISKDGTYALVTEKDGYLSKLYVYSNDNKQIFAYSFADYYITSVSLSPKGNSVVLTGLSAHNGTQYSAVYLLSFTKEEPVVFEEFEDNILYYSEHLTNNTVCVIGDTATYTLNTLTKKFTTTSYEGKLLTSFDVNPDTNTFALSLSSSGDGRKCEILSFSSSGVLKKSFSTDLMVTDMSIYKNRVGLLSSGKVYLYSKDGTLITEKDAGLAPHSLVLYSTTDAYILGVSEIRRLDF